MRPGYKQTEVGVIPEDWEVCPLASIAALERGKFSARPRNDPKFFGGSIPFIQTGDVGKSTGCIQLFSQTLNQKGLSVSRLFPKGTLFFTIAANIGDVGISMFAAACPDSLVALTPREGVEKEWLLQELARRKCDFEQLATPGAQLNLNLEKLRPFTIVVPPLPEQRAIAEALADADAAVAGLERLIAKKRDLKQAAMQQLLTGQTRLPGFSGAWEVKRLGEVSAIRTGPFGAQLHERDYVAVGTPIVTVEHLGEFGIDVSNGVPMVADDDCKRLSNYKLREGDIVFSRVGSVDRNALVRW